LTAECAAPATARLLGVKTRTALLVEQRLILDQNAKPLELTSSRYVGDRYALDVTFDVQHP
jgi:GntR family transcriptional regulator